MDPELTPAQEEAVRRQLAAARHDRPMPPDVAARMDEVVADMVAERAAGAASDPDADPAPVSSGSEPEELASVTPLRRRWPQVLLAAAAVAVVGFGVTQVLPTGESGDDSTAGSSSESQVDRESLSTDDYGSAGEPPESARESAPTAAPPKADAYDAPLDRLLSQYPQLSRIPGVTASKGGGSELHSLRDSGCGPATLPAGVTAIPVLYRDQDALAVFGLRGNPQRVAIYACEGADPRTPVTTLRVPAGE